MAYKLEIYSKAGQLVADLSNVRRSPLTLNQVRNYYDTMRVTFDLDNICQYAASQSQDWTTIFAVDENEMRLSSGDTVVSSCLIVDAYPTINGDTHSLQVTGFGWFHLLGFRYSPADAIYSSEDAGVVAWDLINTSQTQLLGDIGITEGTIQTSVNVNREYTSKNIRDALTELSATLNGFDFEITWNKVFNVYYPKIGSDQTNTVIFTYPGNVNAVSFDRDGTKLFNRCIAVGSGSGVNVSKEISTDSTSAGRFYLREQPVIVSDLAGSDALQAKADAGVLLYKNFIDVPTITAAAPLAPSFSSYRTGDIVQFQSDHPAYSMVAGSYRVDARELTLDENDFESTKITLLK